MNEWTNERMNEWMKEWMNEGRKEGTNERTNAWMHACMHEWVSEWVNEWMSEWVNEWMNEGRKEGRNERTNECMNACMHACMNEWVNEWMSEWVNEWVSEWMNEWMKEGRKEGRKERTNECMNACMHAWMSEWMSEWVNEWMSEWVNEWMNERMHECMNEWTNEGNKWMNERMNERTNEGRKEWATNPVYQYNWEPSKNKTQYLCSVILRSSEDLPTVGWKLRHVDMFAMTLEAPQANSACSVENPHRTIVTSSDDLSAIKRCSAKYFRKVPDLTSESPAGRCSEHLGVIRRKHSLIHSAGVTCKFLLAFARSDIKDARIVICRNCDHLLSIRWEVGLVDMCTMFLEDLQTQTLSIQIQQTRRASVRCG